VRDDQTLLLDAQSVDALFPGIATVGAHGAGVLLAADARGLLVRESAFGQVVLDALIGNSSGMKSVLANSNGIMADSFCYNPSPSGRLR
jgi:hypothetical protein